MLKVAIGSDHSAFKYRVEIKKELEKKNYKIKDFGIYEEKPSRNYEVAEKVALSVSNGESDRGILICGTGIGMSISANKIPGTKAALCYNLFSAVKAREHNDSNILVMGARVIGLEFAKEIAVLWLETSYEGGRHIERNDHIMELDSRYRKLP